jgi:methylase of polypeptide subunit release factors
MSKNNIEKKIVKLRAGTSLNEVVWACINVYCQQNELSIEVVRKQKECSLYYQERLDFDLIEFLEKEIPLNSYKNLEAVFESLIDLDRKKSEGVVYTPDYIIDYIIERALTTLPDNIEIPLICDPACGSGGFLIRAIDKLVSNFQVSIDKAINFIRGIDVNPEAISFAKVLLEIYCVQQGCINSSDKLDKNIICGDSLLTDKSKLLKKINAENGIDLLLTNPPYVKLQNIEADYRKKLIDKYSRYAQGSFSFAMLFIISGMDLLSERGVLGYITQNNLFTSLAAQNIRQKLQANQSIHTIVDFLHNKVFENASAYTCLVFITKQGGNRDFFYKWACNPENDLNDDSFSRIPFATLDAKKWRLAPLNHLENIRLIEGRDTKLKDLAKISVGFATLKDSVFLLNKEQIEKYKIEDGVTIPAIKIAEMNSSEDLENNSRRIIFPYFYKEGNLNVFSENQMQTDFPNAYMYLLERKDTLMSRSKSEDLKYFYEWGRRQSMSPTRTKLLTKTFSDGPNFMLDHSSSLYCNGYAVKPKVQNDGTEVIEIEVLQKILNSTVMDYYTKLTSFQIGGNYQCFQKNFIENFGIPELNEESIEFIKNACQLEVNEYLLSLYHIAIQDVLDVLQR